MFYKLELGKHGEKIAEKYLKRKGYFFIARNYWAEHGELDLVFLRFRTLVFVEVKTRNSSKYGTGREAVDIHKQRAIKTTAKEFVRSHCKDNKVPFFLFGIPIHLKYKKIRFDVIEVSFNGGFFVNAHLKDYFK